MMLVLLPFCAISLQVLLALVVFVQIKFLATFQVVLRKGTTLGNIPP